MTYLTYSAQLALVVVHIVTLAFFCCCTGQSSCRGPCCISYPEAEKQNQNVTALNTIQNGQSPIIPLDSEKVVDMSARNGIVAVVTMDEDIQLPRNVPKAATPPPPYIPLPTTEEITSPATPDERLLG